MKKIPTLFQRDPLTHQVTDKVTPGCEWVLAGEGTATRKFDGTCCLVRGGKLFKRREIRINITAPENFELVETDPVAGKSFGWVPVEDRPENVYHLEAWRNLPPNFPPPDGTYELVGPNVQGNPVCFPGHQLVPHGGIEAKEFPRTFWDIRAALANLNVEGIVFHHPDGRMAKIKKKDYGLPRKPSRQGVTT